MGALDLFPSRVAFVDPQGRLTPEAFRALRDLFGRVGGTYGDQGEDTFAVFGAASESAGLDLWTVRQAEEQWFMSPVELQPASAGFDAPDIQQTESVGFVAEMVFQGESNGAPIQAVTVGASPYAYTAPQQGALSIQGGTVSAVTLKRGGTTVTLGLTAGLVPVSTGDVVTITYTAAPTLNLIPR